MGKAVQKFGITMLEDLRLTPACTLFCSNGSLYSNDN